MKPVTTDTSWKKVGSIKKDYEQWFSSRKTPLDTAKEPSGVGWNYGFVRRKQNEDIFYVYAWVNYDFKHIATCKSMEAGKIALELML